MGAASSVNGEYPTSENSSSITGEQLNLSAILRDDDDEAKSILNTIKKYTAATKILEIEDEDKPTVLMVLENNAKDSLDMENEAYEAARAKPNDNPENTK